MMGDLSVSKLLLMLFFAIPFGVLIYMFWLFWTRAHDSEPNSISVQYEPPDNLTPSECGTLVDDAVALYDITATLTDLSVKGYLAIEQKHHGDLPSDQQGYIFHLMKPMSDWDNLRSHDLVNDLGRMSNPAGSEWTPSLPSDGDAGNPAGSDSNT